MELQPESTNPVHQTIQLDAQMADVEIVVVAIVGARRCESDGGCDADPSSTSQNEAEAQVQTSKTATGRPVGANG